MANRYAVATGNWSNTATWDGGTLPSPGDTVRPNGFTVTIDQDLTGTAYTLTNNASAPAAANGAFQITSIPGGGRTLNVNLTSATSTTLTILLTVSATSGTLTINGTVTGSNIQGSVCLKATGAGTTINLNGNVIGGGGTSTWGIELTAAVTLNIVGNLTTSTGGVSATVGASTVNITGTVDAGTGSAADGAITVTSATTVTINGAVTGPNNTTNSNVSSGIKLNATGAVANITGTCTGGGGSGGSARKPAVHVQVGTVTITGNCIGGGTSGATVRPGLYLDSASAVATVNGDALGAVSSASPGIDVNQNGTLTVNGNVTASATAPGISTGTAALTPAINIVGNVTATTGAHGFSGGSTLTSPTIRIQGNLTDASNARVAAYSPVIVFDASPTVVTHVMRGDNGFPVVGSTVTLTTSGTNGLPLESNVRRGTLYGPSNTLTGTQYPAITAAAVWDHLLSAITTSGSIGAYLKASTTHAAMAAMLASALNDNS